MVRDDFNSGIINPVNWTTETTALTSRVEIPDSGAAVELTNRGFLTSTRRFVPSPQAPVRVTADFRFTGAPQDSAMVVVRSTGVRNPISGSAGHVSSGFQCYFFNGTLGIVEKRAGTLQAAAEGTLQTTLGTPFSDAAARSFGLTFEVMDTGDVVTCTLRLKGDSRSFTVQRSGPFVDLPGDRVTFYNRNSATTPFTTQVDTISIEQGAPRPSHQWSFDDVAGSGIYPHGEDAGVVGTIIGTPTFGQGVLGNSFSTSDGASHKARFGTAVGRMNADPFTVGVWFRSNLPMPATERLRMTLFGNRNNPTTGARWLSMRLHHAGTASPFAERVYFETYTATPGVLVEPRYEDTSLATGWHHVAIARDPSGVGLWTLYVDGVSVATRNGLVNVDDVVDFELGHETNGGGLGFIGDFDDLRIYRGRALNVCEVQAIAGRAPPSPPGAPMGFGLKTVMVGASAGATKYVAEQAPPGGPWTIFAVSDLPTIEFAVHLVRWGNAVRVRACNEAGCSAAIDAVSPTSFAQPDSVRPTGHFSLGTADAHFGSGVAVSADGSLMAVGSPGTLAVHVYRRGAPGSWSQLQRMPAPAGNPRRFGATLALSGNGRTLAVGAPAESSAHLYEWNDTSGQFEAPPGNFGTGPASDLVGTSLSVSGDGRTVAVGAPGAVSGGVGASGTVTVYARPASTWIRVGSVSGARAGDEFGRAVALSADGARLAVGAPGDDCPPGPSGACTPSGTIDNSGAVYLYAVAGLIQSARVKLTSGAQNQFGTSVAVSGDGRTLVVGSPGAQGGSVSIYGTNDFSTWQPQFGSLGTFPFGWANAQVGDRIGASVAVTLNGARVAVGAPNDRQGAVGVHPVLVAPSGFPGAGAVGIFELDSMSRWGLVAYVKASNTHVESNFGHQVALNADGQTLAVGAPGAEVVSSTPLIGPGLTQVPMLGAAADAGVVYVY